MAAMPSNGTANGNGHATNRLNGHIPSKNGHSHEDRLPPHDREAEAAVLGSMIRDNRVADDVMQVLTPDDFYMDAHKRICAAIFDTWNRGRAVDLVTLADVLKQRNFIADVGGYGYLAKLFDAAPTSANCREYCAIVRDKAQTRKLIAIATKTLRDASDEALPGDELIAEAEQSLFTLTDTGRLGEVLPLSASVPAAMDRLDERSRTRGTISGIPTGIGALDEITAGMQDGELTIIAARPSVGKTSLGVAIAHHVSVNLKMPALFVSLEQTRDKLTERLIAYESRVDGHKLRTGTFTSDDVPSLVAASDRLAAAPLFIDEGPNRMVARIASLARRLRRKNRIRLAIIDYLQIIDAGDRRVQRWEQIGLITRRLQHLSRELKIPVVALAQISRQADDGSRPRLSHLREGGDQEQDADVVVLMHRPNVLDEKRSNSPTNLIEADVAKNRDGRTGVANLLFRRACMRFEPVVVAHTPFDERVVAP